MTITINLGQPKDFTQAVWPTIFTAIADALSKNQTEESENLQLIDQLKKATLGYQEQGLQYVVENPQFNKLKIDFTDESDFSYTMALPDKETQADNPSAYTAHVNRMYDYVIFNLEDKHSQNETSIIFDLEEPDYLLLQVDNNNQTGSQGRRYY